MSNNFSKTYLENLNNSIERKYLIKKEDHLKFYRYIESLANVFFSDNHLEKDEKTITAFYEYIETSIKINRDSFLVYQRNFEVFLKPIVAVIYLEFTNLN